MSVIDLIIYIVLALSLFIGFIMGFSKKRLSSFASQAGFLVAYFAGAPLVKVLSNTNLSFYIQNGYASLLPTTEAFSATIASDTLTRNNQMSAALNEIHIFKIFHSFFTSRATDFTSTVSEAIASSFMNWTLVVGVYLILFFLTFILIRVIFSPLWKENALFGEKGKSFFGRICGSFRMVFKSSISIICVMIIMSLISSLMVKMGNTSLSDWINTDLNIQDGTSFSIGKMFYQTSSYFFNWIGLSTGA